MVTQVTVLTPMPVCRMFQMMFGCSIRPPKDARPPNLYLSGPASS